MLSMHTILLYPQAFENVESKRICSRITMGKIASLREYLRTHRTQREFFLFMFYGTFALIAELLCRFFCDIGFQNLDTMLDIWPFPEQALGSFLAFLISNILAKTISFVFNRKKTFRANNSAVFSAVLYTIVCILLIVFETIIGTPLQNRLYILLGGRFTEVDFSSSAASNQHLYQWCGTFSQLIYCTADSVILFLMNKYVIMKHKDIKQQNQ